MAESVLDLFVEAGQEQALLDDTGSTRGGKKFRVVKIEMREGMVRTARIKEKATLIVRDLTRRDIVAGETIYID